MKKDYEKPIAELVVFEINGSIATTVDCGGEVPKYIQNPFYDDECGTTVYCTENTFANFVS